MSKINLPQNIKKELKKLEKLWKKQDDYVRENEELNPVIDWEIRNTEDRIHYLSKRYEKVLESNGNKEPFCDNFKY